VDPFWLVIKAIAAINQILCDQILELTSKSTPSL